MQFRKSISTLLLVTMLLWSVSAMCAPVTTLRGPSQDKMAYRTMVLQHPQMPGMISHHHAPGPVIVVVCYRMHGDRDCDSMARRASMNADEAISGTAKYHDDGQARACATAHAFILLMREPAPCGANWERAGVRYQKPVFEAKADLRI